MSSTPKAIPSRVAEPKSGIKHPSGAGRGGAGQTGEPPTPTKRALCDVDGAEHPGVGIR